MRKVVIKKCVILISAIAFTMGARAEKVSNEKVMSAMQRAAAAVAANDHKAVLVAAEAISKASQYDFAEEMVRKALLIMDSKHLPDDETHPMYGKAASILSLINTARRMTFRHERYDSRQYRILKKRSIEFTGAANVFGDPESAERACKLAYELAGDIDDLLVQSLFPVFKPCLKEKNPQLYAKAKADLERYFAANPAKKKELEDKQSKELEKAISLMRDFMRCKGEFSEF